MMKKIQVITIRHYGAPFVSTTHARLIATGMLHHVVLLIDE